MSTVVTTQKELDKALKAGTEFIEIRSERGVWLEVLSYGSATVRASGSATVRASGSATVRAYGSATVRASGSATVRAYDSATVRAYDSATVTASGSATVTAYDSATVRAYDSATVTAYDSATVTAYDSATVTASSHTAVHLHSGRVTLEGGVVIDHAKVDLEDAETWAEYHGVEVVDGVATVYKAVDDRYTTDRGFDYSPGAQPSAPDWKATRECGNGLHFGPTPSHAVAYHPGATKFMAAKVALADLVTLTGSGTAKCKAPRVVAPLVEVTIDGVPLVSEEAAA